MMKFQNYESSFCWERGRLVRTEREARKRSYLTNKYFALPARCGRDVRAPSIEFTAILQSATRPSNRIVLTAIVPKPYSRPGVQDATRPRKGLSPPDSC